MTIATSRRGLMFTALAGIAALPLAACTKEEVADCAGASPPIKTATPATPLADWMSWEGGVDLVAMTDASLTQPNVIVHLARMVHTPAGSAPSGMVMYQPDAKAPPVVIGFVSADPAVGAYFGPKIFAGTPFEKAPVLDAEIAITEGNGTAGSTLKAGGHTFEVHFDDLAPVMAADRAAGDPMPFLQRTIEATAGKVTLKVDGKDVALTVPAIGLSGGAAAVWAPAGFYAR
ncbi:MAG: hypothetical protein WDN06_22960 [Asticcacaulis sp.]